MEGNRIKYKRKRLRMSVYDISRKTGLSPSYISNLENNKKVNPTKMNMEKVAEALNSTVPEIFY
ncbi:MAG TPA: XRE family transcriptional regulator [Clostridium sp.]|nr:XRE family transcriptional regulator [Clostridium sp.]